MLKHKYGFYLFTVLFAFIISPSQGLAAPAAPKAKIIVAKSGGNYTTITAALNAITPSATNRYVIEVWPGTYVEQVTLKGYVHLMGSGRDVTIIQSPNTAYINVVSLTNLTDVTLSGFTIQGIPATTNINIGINNQGSAARIENNKITGVYHAIANNMASPSITGNTISGNFGSGILEQNGSSSTIENNTIIANDYGIQVGSYSTSLVKGNTVVDNTVTGIYNDSSSALIMNNKLTGNGTDIFISGSATPTVSLNIYNTLTGGGRGLGVFNGNSSGGLAPAP